MPPEGIEPSTSRLRGACSAEIELRRQSGHSRSHRIWRSYSVFRDRISGARGRTKPSRRQTLHGEGGIRTPNVRTHAGFTDQVPNRSVSSPSVFGVPYAPGTNSVFSAFQMPLKRQRPGHLSGPAFRSFLIMSLDLRAKPSRDITVLVAAGGLWFRRGKTHERGRRAQNVMQRVH